MNETILAVGVPHLGASEVAIGDLNGASIDRAPDGVGRGQRAGALAPKYRTELPI